MTDHTIDVHFTADSGAVQAAAMQRAAQAALIQAAVVERMAYAASAPLIPDAAELDEARRVYVMVLSMFAGLAEAGVMDFSVKG
jgi:hypothetical protein